MNDDSPLLRGSEELPSTPSDLTAPGAPREEPSDGSADDGDLPSSQLRLDPEAATCQGLSDAFKSVVRYGEAMVERAVEEPEKGVHEYRKSVRRLRSLVKLLRRELGEEIYGSLNGSLRDAVSETSGLRDTRILRETLVSIPQHDSIAEARKFVLERLDRELAELASNAVEFEALQRASEPLGRIHGRFDLALSGHLSQADVTAALKHGYARVRRAYQRVQESPKDQRLHDWRKRVKELRYQSELLAVVGGEPLSRWRKQLALLAKALGEVTDLVVLEGYLDTLEGSKKAPRIAKLRKRVRRLRRGRVAEVLAEYGDLFAPKPRRFVAEVMAAAPEKK